MDYALLGARLRGELGAQEQNEATDNGLVHMTVEDMAYAHDTDDEAFPGIHYFEMTSKDLHNVYRIDGNYWAHPRGFTKKLAPGTSVFELALFVATGMGTWD